MSRDEQFFLNQMAAQDTTARVTIAKLGLGQGWAFKILREWTEKGWYKGTLLAIDLGKLTEEGKKAGKHAFD